MRIAERTALRGQDLGDLAAAVDGLNLTYFETPLSALRVDPAEGGVSLLGDTYTLTGTSLAQLCRELKVPAAYIASAPNDLAAENLNYLLPSARRNVQLVIRGEDQLMGIMSSQYQPVGPAALIERAAARSGMNLSGWSLDDAGLRMRSIVPTHVVEPKVGDIVRLGVDLLWQPNDREIDANGVLERLVCTNGATMPVDQYIARTLRKERWKEAEARLGLLFDNVDLAIAEAGRISTSLSELPSIELPVPDEPEEREPWIKPYLSVMRVPGTYALSVSDALRAEDASLFGLYNAVTRLGRDSSTSDVRRVFERAGYEVLRQVEKLRALTEGDADDPR